MLHDTQTMKAFTRLAVLPSMTSDELSLERIKQMRKQPLPGEEHFVWAIQTDNDASTRQLLPVWIADPVQRAVAKWSETKAVWTERIERMENQALTKAKQQDYNHWLAHGQEAQFLFSREKEKEIKRIRKNANLKHLEEDVFSVQINFCLDDEMVFIKAGDGAVRRLVVLSMTEVANPQLPDFLDHKIPEALLREAAAEGALVEEEDQDQADDLDQQGCEDGEMQQQEALLKADTQDQDAQEILADSSDEEDLADLVGRAISAPVSRVKSFMHREEWLKLEGLGLTMLPVGKGIYIGCHASSRTWQGFYPSAKSGMSFTWGPSTKRTPAEACLKAIRGIVEHHCQLQKKDRLWQSQLEKIIKAEATLDF